MSSNPSISNTSPDYARARRRPRVWGLVLVLGLHGLLLWAIQSGLARQTLQKSQQVVQALLLPEPPAVKPPPPAPVPPSPKTPPPTPTPAPSPAPVVAPPTPQSVVLPSPPPAVAAPAAPAPAAPPQRVSAGMRPGASCAKPSYPPASRRLEEEGTVRLRFLIGTEGQVLQAEVEKSSGFPRLDEAARAALAKCQFRPGTVDGKPEASWASMEYHWRLE